MNRRFRRATICAIALAACLLQGCLHMLAYRQWQQSETRTAGVPPALASPTRPISSAPREHSNDR